jgi:hypothetical protein
MPPVATGRKTIGSSGTAGSVATLISRERDDHPLPPACDVDRLTQSGTAHTRRAFGRSGATIAKKDFPRVDIFA